MYLPIIHAFYVYFKIVICCILRCISPFDPLLVKCTSITEYNTMKKNQLKLRYKKLDINSTKTGLLFAENNPLIKTVFFGKMQ